MIRTTITAAAIALTALAIGATSAQARNSTAQDRLDGNNHTRYYTCPYAMPPNGMSTHCARVSWFGDGIGSPDGSPAHFSVWGTDCNVYFCHDIRDDYSTYENWLHHYNEAHGAYFANPGGWSKMNPLRLFPAWLEDRL